MPFANQSKAHHVSVCLLSLAWAVCLGGFALARDITSFDIYDATGNEVYEASLTLTSDADAGRQIVYFAWSSQGDAGESLSAWPHICRIGAVAAEETAKTFRLPPPAAQARIDAPETFAARVFLATSDHNYDYFVEGTKSGGGTACYLDTGFKPQEGKTILSLDCVYPSIAFDVYLFGCYNDRYSMACYFNSSKEWALACNDNTPSGRSTGYAGAVNERVRVTVDATGTTATTGSVTVVETGVKHLAVNASAHQKTGAATSYNRLFLWGRSDGANANKKSSSATIYSCVITNGGVCVRDYRPAVKDGVAGMWDAVNNTFTASAGKTALVAVGTNTTYFVAEGDRQMAVSPRWKVPIVVEHVWTGAAGDGLLTTPGNWQHGTVPDFTDGLAHLVFGDGTRQATVSGVLNVYGLSIAAAADFTLAAADDAARIRLGYGGLAAKNTSEAGDVTVTLAVPVAFAASPQNWSVATRTVLDISAPVSSSGFDDDALTVDSPGRCRFRVDNPDLLCPLVLKNTTPAYRPQIFAARGLGPAGRTATISGSVPEFQTADAPLTNAAALAVSIAGSGALNSSAAYPLVFGENVAISNGGSVTLPLFSESEVCFAGGLSKKSGTLTLRQQDGRVTIADTVEVGGTFYVEDTMTLALGTTNAAWEIFNPQRATVVCLASNVFAKTATIEVGSSTSGKYRQASATIDLNGFGQRIRRLKRGWNYNDALPAQANGYGTVTSLTPATLEVASDVTASAGVDHPKTYLFTAFRFTGAAGFHFSGTGTFGFTNKLSTTTGELRVSSGTVNLWAGAGWIATTNVVVEGTGTLAVRENAGATAFGPAAGESACRMTIAGEGVLSLAAGETATVRTLSIEKTAGRFRSLPVGVYGGADAGLDAAHTLTCLSGAGRLRVLRQTCDGFRIILR